MALLGRLDDFRKIGVPIQCDVDDARLLQGFHNRKAKIIKGDICEERGHRRLMRDEGETKLTPQEQSLNEEIEKLQDQWPYLMNEIFFIDYLKNPTYERGLAAKSKILVCFNDELLAAFLSAYKKANISEQQEMLTILKEISFRGGAVERDETDTEVTRKNLEKLENALNSEVEHVRCRKKVLCKQTFGDCKANQTKVLEHKGNVTTRTKDRTKLVSYIECDTNKSPRQHEVTLGIVVIWRLFTDSEKSSPRKARESPS